MARAESGLLMRAADADPRRDRIVFAAAPLEAEPSPRWPLSAARCRCDESGILLSWRAVRKARRSKCLGY
jgi:hypothetical protein